MADQNGLSSWFGWNTKIQKIYNTCDRIFGELSQAALDGSVPHKK